MESPILTTDDGIEMSAKLVHWRRDAHVSQRAASVKCARADKYNWLGNHNSRHWLASEEGRLFDRCDRCRQENFGMTVIIEGSKTDSNFVHPLKMEQPSETTDI